MNRRQLLQIALPLVALTSGALLVHLRWPADGFFLNLAAGFVGSLVTVGYIDWILRRHEKDRWKDAHSRIDTRLRTLASGTITGIRTSFGYGMEVFDRRTMESTDAIAMRAEVLRVARDVLSPNAEARVAALDRAQWKSLVGHLQHSSAECGVILDRFGHRLDPATMTVVLDLQASLESAQIFWRVFPDIAGVPAVDLPNTSTPPEELQAAWCDLTARDIRSVLNLASELSSRTSDA